MILLQNLQSKWISKYEKCVLYGTVANCKQENKRKSTISPTQLCCSVDVSGVRVFVGGFLSLILSPLETSEEINRSNVERIYLEQLGQTNIQK